MRRSRSAAVGRSGVDAGADGAVMAIEIRRFGVGHRQATGPIGSVGLTGGTIHADGRGSVAEVVLARNARIEPHANPNTTYFIVIEGGGWVGVGDEWTRIAAGEAAVWPADIPHAAWTEHSEMRAIVVEFAGPDDSESVVGRARVTGNEGNPAERGVGELVARSEPRPTRDPGEGEPA
jgi:quercetin dioxygenase-like cupin family protein